MNRSVKNSQNAVVYFDTPTKLRPGSTITDGDETTYSKVWLRSSHPRPYETIVWSTMDLWVIPENRLGGSIGLWVISIITSKGFDCISFSSSQ